MLAFWQITHKSQRNSIAYKHGSCGGMQKYAGVLCRHHQAYVRKLKEALRKAPELLEKDLNQLMQSVGTIGIWHPEVDQDVRNHGGGALKFPESVLLWLCPGLIRAPMLGHHCGALTGNL